MRPPPTGASENIYLPPESGSSQGWFKPTEFQAAMMSILDSVNPPKRLYLMKSARIGYTTTIQAVSIHHLVQRHRHVVIYLPSDPDAKTFGKTGLSPMMRDSPPCREIQELAVESGDGREARTSTMKMIGGKILRIIGAHVPGRFRGITADTVILDELDDYPDVGEGDVVSLAARASTNSPWKLMIVGSTPTAKSTSQIARAMESVDLILDWNIPCPECGEHQAPKWSDIVFSAEGEDVERAASAKMACRACGVLWTHDRLQGGRFQAADDVVAEGSLSDGKPWPARVGLRINALSSPFTRWSDLVLDWLAAQGDILKLQVFTNHVLGETWVDEDIVVDKASLQREKMTGEEFPEGVLTVIAGVDVQDGWISVLVVGFGLGEEAWVLDRATIKGDITHVAGDGWEKLRNWLGARPTWGGLEISAVAIDSGYETKTVYDVVATLPAEAIHPMKGIGGWNRAMVKFPPTKVKATNRTVLMWNMGTDQSKARIASRLQTGGIHFADNLPPEVFDEVTAEVLTVTRRSGRVVRQWRLKVGKKRNEALDCLGMAFASLHILKPKWLRTSESRQAARKFVQAKRLEQAEKKTVEEIKPEDYMAMLRRMRKEKAAKRARTWF